MAVPSAANSVNALPKEIDGLSSDVTAVPKESSESEITVIESVSPVHVLADLPSAEVTETRGEAREGTVPVRE
jgi:hypothetical protein